MIVLTERCFKIAEMIVAGISTPRICADIKVAAKTVRDYRRMIRQALDIPGCSAEQLCLALRAHGLTDVKISRAGQGLLPLPPDEYWKWRADCRAGTVEERKGPMRKARTAKPRNAARCAVEAERSAYRKSLRPVRSPLKLPPDYFTPHNIEPGDHIGRAPGRSATFVKKGEW